LTGHARRPAPCHVNVEEFRRELTQSAEMFRDLMEQHAAAFRDAVKAPTGNGKRAHGAPSDAYTAALMAANYAYTLAALLGVAHREFGSEVSGRLADLADGILTNGDDSGRNADVMPGGSPCAPPTEVKWTPDAVA